MFLISSTEEISLKNLNEPSVTVYRTGVAILYKAYDTAIYPIVELLLRSFSTSFSPAPILSKIAAMSTPLKRYYKLIE